MFTERLAPPAFTHAIRGGERTTYIVIIGATDGLLAARSTATDAHAGERGAVESDETREGPNGESE